MRNAGTRVRNAGTACKATTIEWWLAECRLALVSHSLSMPKRRERMDCPSSVSPGSYPRTHCRRPRRRRVRHRQRNKRHRGFFLGVTYVPAPWWAGVIAQVSRIVRESGNVVGFDSEAWLAQFLGALAPAVGGRVPISLMHTAERLAQVSRLIAQMQTSVYV